MQMLESFFGAQGARYAGFVLAALAILLLVIVLWWLIRKAMGGRLNMSDRPDRRGRPPRLGITESFAVDRQGRRLVMVRRDNVEHLVMIGGPNDVVIETNVVRGERPMVGRPDARGAEPEVIPTLALSDIAPSPAPIPMPTPPLAKPSTPMAPPKPVEPPPVKVVEPTPPPKPAPAPLPPPIAPPAPPVAAPPKPPVVEPVAPRPAPPAAPVETPPPAPAKSGMTLVERIKAGLPMGKPSLEPAKAATTDAPVEAKPAIIEDIKARIEGVAKTPPSPPKPDEMKAALEEAVKNEAAKAAAKAPDLKAAEAKAAEIKAKIEEAMRPAAPPPPPPLPPSPAPAAAPPAPAPVAQATAAPAAKVASKNPFDSLEEEMAKLLGRAPDGKG
jgi:flagellar protein FliO/FliZ